MSTAFNDNKLKGMQQTKNLLVSYSRKRLGFRRARPVIPRRTPWGLMHASRSALSVA